MPLENRIQAGKGRASANTPFLSSGGRPAVGRERGEAAVALGEGVAQDRPLTAFRQGVRPRLDHGDDARDRLRLAGGNDLPVRLVGPSDREAEREGQRKEERSARTGMEPPGHGLPFYATRLGRSSHG
jgi:hypothetical protein